MLKHVAVIKEYIIFCIFVRVFSWFGKRNQIYIFLIELSLCSDVITSTKLYGTSLVLHFGCNVNHCRITGRYRIVLSQ